MNSQKSTNNINDGLSSAPSSSLSNQVNTSLIVSTEDEKEADASTVHQAFVNLINYAHVNELDALLDANANLNLKKEAIEGFFPFSVRESIQQLLPHSNTLEDLKKGYKGGQVIREAIDNLRGAINSSVELIDSCGEVANNVCNYFLGKDGSILQPIKENLESFFELNDNEEEIIAIVKSFSPIPVLIRVHIWRCETYKKIATHSYCLFVWEDKVSPETESLVVYQAYFGGYTLADWFKDPKSTQQPVDFHSYAKTLTDLLSSDEKIRKESYGRLFRLSGTEREVPSKKLLKVIYKVAPVNTNIALTNIKYLQEALIKLKDKINNEEKLSPIEYLKKICWDSVQNDFAAELKKENLKKLEVIQNMVKLVSKEIAQKEALFDNPVSELPIQQTISNNSLR